MYSGVLTKGGTEATDANTVVFHLDRPVADFPYYVSRLTFNAAIIQNGVDPATFQKHAIGTGPFIMDSFVPQQSATFHRNPNYWQPGKPYLDGVHFIYYGENSPEVIALQTGDIDLMLETPYQGSQALFSDSTIDITYARSSSFRQIYMKVDRAPWTDKRVRQALACCLDRPAIMQALFKGQADVGNDHAFAPVFPTFVPIQQRTQDYAKAKQLLAQAGMPNGFKATLTSENYLEIPQYLTIVREQASKAGIDITLHIETQADYYGSGSNQPWIEVPFGCVDWASRGTASQLIVPAFLSNALWNVSHWSNKTYDSLLKQLDATSTSDPAARQSIAKEMEEIQNDEVGSIIAYWLWLPRAMRNNVRGIPINDTTHLDLSGAYLSA